MMDAQQGQRTGKRDRYVHNKFSENVMIIFDKTFVFSLDFSDKIKEKFFQAVAMSILRKSCTTWTLIKKLKKKLNESSMWIIHFVLNKSW